MRRLNSLNVRECRSSVSNSPVVFVVRFYCLNEDVEYGFIFKFIEEEILIVSTLSGI